jgi:hypothetical protein
MDSSVPQRLGVRRLVHSTMEIACISSRGEKETLRTNYNNTDMRNWYRDGISVIAERN